MIKKDFIIVLPPSEGKKEGGDRKGNFLEERDEFNLNKFRKEIIDDLINTMSKLPEEKLEKIFDVKGNNLVKVIEKNSAIYNSLLMRSIDRYDGVMFKAIDYEKLSDNLIKRFDEKILFIDGVFGLLRPNDMIPDYKMKIDSKLYKNDVTKFWKNCLNEIMKELFENKIVIDILPQAHRKVIEDISKNIDIITIEFYEFKKGKYVSSGHSSKKLKGEIIRYLIEFDKLSIEDIKKFEHSEGYTYNENLSTDKKIVFLKE